MEIRSDIFRQALDEVPQDVKIQVALSHQIANTIDNTLRQRGLSQKDLAHMTGRKPSEVSQWLNGRHNFTLRTIAVISAALDISLVNV